MSHIRVSNDNVKDHRFRSTSRLPNKLRPTLCGAQPSLNDVSRADALHMMSPGIVAVCPQWSADLCSACKEKLRG